MNWTLIRMTATLVFGALLIGVVWTNWARGRTPLNEAVMVTLIGVGFLLYVAPLGDGDTASLVGSALIFFSVLAVVRSRRLRNVAV